VWCQLTWKQLELIGVAAFERLSERLVAGHAGIDIHRGLEQQRSQGGP
jgi:hypothetical protein